MTDLSGLPRPRWISCRGAAPGVDDTPCLGRPPAGEHLHGSPVGRSPADVLNSTDNGRLRQPRCPSVAPRPTEGPLPGRQPGVTALPGRCASPPLAPGNC